MSNKFYQVEKIINKKITPDGIKYLIKWVGWPKEDSTWEPISNLQNVMYMVREYEESQKEVHLISDDEVEEKVAFEEKKKNGIGQKRNRDIVPRARRGASSSEEEFVRAPKKQTAPKMRVTPKPIVEKEIRPIETTLELKDSSEDEDKNTPGNVECDIPEKIVSARIKNNKDVVCLVEWKKRYNGGKPEETWVSNKVLREKYPLLLIDYYESKLQTKTN